MRIEAKQYAWAEADAELRLPDHQRACEFADTLAWAVEHGVPLPSALASLLPSAWGGFAAKCLGNPFIGGILSLLFFGRRRYLLAVQRVIEELEKGKPLGLALRKCMRRYLPPCYIAAVEEAEYSNHLEKYLPVLSRALHRPGILDQRKDTAWGCSYAVILILLFTITTGLMYFIVPKFEKMFSEMVGANQLPKSTRLVLAVSVFFQQNLLFLILGIGLCFILAFLRRRILRSLSSLPLVARLKPWRLIDWAYRCVPILGTWLRRRDDLETVRHLALTASVREDLLKSVQLAAKGVPAFAARCKLHAYHRRLQSGENAAAAWRDLELTHPALSWIIINGLHREALQEALQTATELAAERLRHSSARLSTGLLLAMLLIMGLLIGTICHGMFSAIYQIVEGLAV